MEAYRVENLVQEQRARGDRYYEFLLADALSLGLFHLAAGQEDPQQPHTEDEIYYVLEGRGRFRYGEDDWAVEPGSLIFVEARAPHHFHTIEEDLRMLVVFAPPRGSQA